MLDILHWIVAGWRGIFRVSNRFMLIILECCSCLFLIFFDDLYSKKVSCFTFTFYKAEL